MGSTLIRHLLEASGARYGDRNGVEVALDFGDPAREYRAFTSGAALLDRTGRTRIAHAGADALDLLHRLTTNDLLDMAGGQARGTIVTTGDARIIDVLTVVRRQSQPLLLLGSSSTAARVLEWLDQYTFGEDSTPRDVSAETAQLTVVGPEAIRTLASAAKLEHIEIPAGGCVRLALAGQQVEIVRTVALGVDTLDLVFPVAVTQGIWGSLIHAGGAIPAGLLACDAHRVVRGIPEHGAELDERVNPHEANLLPLVSFTKGCYIGQEVVARLDTYDKVQRRLVGVRSDAPLSYGSTLMSDGHAVGEVRTVAGPGLLDGSAALAYARRGFWDPGTVLHLQGGGRAAVYAWPLE